MTCLARQYSDQMLCDHCGGLAWDVNDPDPPPCRVKPEPDGAARTVALGEIDKMLEKRADSGPRFV